MGVIRGSAGEAVAERITFDSADAVGVEVGVRGVEGVGVGEDGRYELDGGYAGFDCVDCHRRVSGWVSDSCNE